jgi:hypothetical protein
MPIAYTLKIDGLDCVPALDGLSNVVSRAIWTMTGVDGDHSATSSASTEFPAPTPEQPFVAFNDLTQATVIGWVEDCTDPDYLASRRAHIADQIAAQISPPVVTPPLPWVEEPAPE